MPGGERCSERGTITAFITAETPEQETVQAFENQPEEIRKYARKAVRRNATATDTISVSLSEQQTDVYANLDVDFPLYVRYRGETIHISFGVPC